MSDAFTFLLHLCCSNVSDFSTEFNLYTFFSCSWNLSSSFLCWIWLTADQNASCTYTHCSSNSSRHFMASLLDDVVLSEQAHRTSDLKASWIPQRNVPNKAKAHLCGLWWPGRSSNILLFLHMSFTLSQEWSGELVTLVVQKAAFITKLTLKPGSTGF